MKKIKERLDKLLPELGLADTRNKAQALIMAGKVRVNDQVITKAGAMFERTPELNITLDEISKWLPISRTVGGIRFSFEYFLMYSRISS